MSLHVFTSNFVLYVRVHRVIVNSSTQLPLLKILHMELAAEVNTNTRVNSSPYARLSRRRAPSLFRVHRISN